jgi:hypothetical protein
MITLDQMRSNDAIIALLGEYFDFEACHEHQTELPDWIVIQADEVFNTIGSEGAGGVFLLGSSSQKILFVTSEGAAGCIANNLTELIQLFSAHPNWKDILHFSDNGQLKAMRDVPVYFEDSLLDDYPDIDEKRLQLLNHFNITPAADPVKNLHLCVSIFDAGALKIRSRDDEAYESLFNHFTLDDNRRATGSL